MQAQISIKPLTKIKQEVKKMINKTMETKKAKKGLRSKISYILLLATITLLNSNIVVYATGGTGTASYSGLDKLFEMFAGILQKVAGGVGLIGAVYFGFSIYSDNPDGKVRAAKLMGAGAFLFAVATGYKVFLT